MYKKRKLPELLSPAGSLDHLKAAVLAGADAVYFGGTKFGARAYAKNFSKEKVIEGLDYLHFHDRRAYMTVNTLLKERELKEELFEYLLPYYEAGLDGVIVQDIGAASFIRDHFPGMEVHGSTQMMITSLSGALKAKELGMNRVVPARELSMEEIVRIKKETGLEIELFIHGALCYCYSGQCLFSSTYGGRSGNRGRCAQPCRLAYKALDSQGKLITDKAKHLLSPKDLYSLETLPSIIEAGMDSLKIEGRMKNVDYVAGVTSIYRKYLDSYDPEKKWKIAQEDKYALEELYSRTGFTDGYWNNHNGKEMMSIDMPRHLGLNVGKILSLKKNQLTIDLSHKVNPKDILVIPLGKEDEIVLTVPSQLDSILHKKKNSWEIVLNAPKSKWLKPGLTVYRRYNDQLSSHIEKNILSVKPDYPVSGQMFVKEEQPIILSLESRGDEIRIIGPTPLAAEKRPINQDDILRQMKKTGNVPFHLEEFKIDLDDNLFVQASQLKDMRQQAYAKLEEIHTKKLYRKTPNMDNVTQTKINSMIDKLNTQSHVAVVYDDKTLDICLENEFFDSILLPMDFFDADRLRQYKSRIHKAGKEACLGLPYVYRQESGKSVEEYLDKTVTDNTEWDVIYINNINEIDIYAEKWNHIPRVFGASLYQWNSNTRQELMRLHDFDGQIHWEIPLEVSGNELKDSINDSVLPLECLVYGRFPLMKSAQCIKKTLGRCNHKEEILYIEDPKKRRLPVSTHCHPGWVDHDLAVSPKTRQACYNLIWTDQPRNLIGEDYEEFSGQTSRYRFDLFGLTSTEIEAAVTNFKSWAKNDFKQDFSKKVPEEHWSFGIE